MASIPEEEFGVFSIRDDLTAADARLAAAFESGSADFVKEVVDANRNAMGSEVHVPQVTNYLQKMERGGNIQSFGWLLAIELESGHHKVIAHSENAHSFLELPPDDVTLGIGTDARRLFKPASAAALEEAIRASDFALVNPLLLIASKADKPFYGILHRIEEGVAIDFEPVVTTGESVNSSVAVRPPHELAGEAVGVLQGVPTGDVTKLCQTMVEQVRKMTGYDRVMAYKFHEDEHGEVVAECKRDDMEPFLGLHYPATDLPQASRFFLMLMRSRLIDNIKVPQPRVIQDPALSQNIRLANSQLRPVHPCHVEYMINMGSDATLMLAVVVKDERDSRREEKEPGAVRLWGLIVCHHASPRFIPYPLRSACVFLAQIFALQIEVEDELEIQLREKHILRIETMLCSMLLRDAPMGVVTQTPNITDLIKCDGAALFHKGKVWILGETPSEDQIKALGKWLLKYHKESSGLSTDSMADAGFREGEKIADKVCGMAAVRFTDEDFLFWFRGPFEKAVKWAGAPENGGKVEPRRPRASFAAFVQVVKNRSEPWEDVEMDAIHSLQLILRENLKDAEVNSQLESTGLNDLQVKGAEDLETLTEELARLSENASVPILATDANGKVISWNNKIAELSGLPAPSALGRSFAAELVHPDSTKAVDLLLEMASNGKHEQDTIIKLKFFDSDNYTSPGALLNVRPCRLHDKEGKLLGIYLVGLVLSVDTLARRFTKLGGQDSEDVHMEPSLLLPPIFGCDEEGRCNHWNQAMVELTGVAANNVLGMPFVEEVIGGVLKLENDEAKAKFERRVGKAKEGKASERRPFAFKTKEGGRKDVLLTINKRVNADNSYKGIYCFLHKVTSEGFHF